MPKNSFPLPLFIYTKRFSSHFCLIIVLGTLKVWKKTVYGRKIKTYLLLLEPPYFLKCDELMIKQQILKKYKLNTILCLTTEKPKNTGKSCILLLSLAMPPFHKQNIQ